MAWTQPLYKIDLDTGGIVLTTDDAIGWPLHFLPCFPDGELYHKLTQDQIKRRADRWNELGKMQYVAVIERLLAEREERREKTRTERKLKCQSHVTESTPTPGS